MNILLPLFPTNAIEKALLPETLRRSPFLRDLAALGGPPPTWRVLAVAADQALLDIVAPFGAQCRLLDVEPEADGCGLLPPGTRRALELLRAGQPGEPGQPAADALWCVLDLGVPEPDAPGLESVQKACELYERETPVAVASVVVVDDHPAQLDAYYRLLDVELLVFLHSAGVSSAHARTDGWLQSTPFFLEWEAFEADAPLVEGQAYALEPGVDSWRVRLETRPPEEADVPGEPGGTVRFCPAGPGLARRLAAARELRVEADRSACAAPCFKALGASSCLLLRESATEMGLYIRQQPGADTPRVRAWLIGGLRLLPVPPLESDGGADGSGLPYGADGRGGLHRARAALCAAGGRRGPGRGRVGARFRAGCGFYGAPGVPAVARAFLACGQGHETAQQRA